ncbi:hypothetical protein LTR59_009309 [Friedmanniomyces endolithicus]|nr:hypothetical protein LTR94_014005 [Friedmanniomyces endolithicus]KAK0785494.1 hypothetical protein LTR38_012328 [Friedmanniomyces endolithicus]KAK0790209.1 hypothetical protein LTR59_009309 [Friedmanniomyces endolithicus]
MVNKKKCARCKGYKPAAQHGHDIVQCAHKTVAAADFTKLWDDFKDVGQPYEPHVDQRACKEAIRNVKPGKIYEEEDIPFTKHILEALFQKAEIGASSSSSKASATTDSAVAGPSSQGPATQELAIRGSASKQQATPQNSSEPTQSQRDTGKGKMPEGAKIRPGEWKTDFRYDNGLQGGSEFECSKGATLPTNKAYAKASQQVPGSMPVTVVTNYVAVKKLPRTVYVYTVEYGGMVSNDDVQGHAQPQASSSTVPAPLSSLSSPPPSRGVMRRSEKRCVFEALKHARPLEGRNDWATDHLTIWSLRPLEDPNTEPHDHQIIPVWDVRFQKPTGRTATLEFVKFIFQYKLEFPAGKETHSLLNPPDGQPEDTLGASVHIAALNGLVSKRVTETSTHVIQVGPNKFFLLKGFTSMPHPLQHYLAPLNAHRGYYSSIRPGSEKVLINVSTKAGTFFNPMKVSTFLDSIDDVKYKEYGTDRTKLLIGRTVRICYERVQHDDGFNPNTDGNRHKTIVGFGKFPSEQEFVTESGEMMSVLKYYKDVLNARPVPNDKFPCVNVGSKSRSDSKAADSKATDGKTTDSKATDKGKGKQDDRTGPKELWIPADLLELDPDQPFPRQLSQHDMDKMLKAAQHTPPKTQLLIADEGLKTLGLTQTNAPSRLIEIEPGLLQISGRRLLPPAIAYRGATPQTPSLAPVNGASWYMHRSDGEEPVKFFKTPSVRQEQGVHVLNFCTGVNGNKGEVMTKLINKRLQEHGISFRQSQPPGYTNVHQSLEAFETDETLKRYINERSKNTKEWPNSQLFLVLLHDAKSDSYARLKRVADQMLGLHNVCLTGPKFAKVDPTFGLLTNLALKFNVKLRGQNHQVSAGTARNVVSAFAALEKDETIVIGADVSHAPTQMSDCPSVAAVVGSLDGDYANFGGSMRLQASKQEVIEDLADMVKERVIAYTLSHKARQLPRNMIFYRDGVGEDQFDCARTVEIERVKTGFGLARAELSREQTPAVTVRPSEINLTFIIVGKRHHTRFFPLDKANTDPTENVKPGLIIDSVITRPTDPKNKHQIFDFFLQSHAALKGTAKSAHYIVLELGTGMTATKIQTITHNFCYNYARAAKGVSYAGPAYYADRLAERGTHYLKGYTTGKEEPEWKWADDEDLKQYQKRVADSIAATPQWNPNPTNPDGSVRKNPWHPSFDKTMFWLAVSPTTRSPLERFNDIVRAFGAAAGAIEIEIVVRQVSELFVEHLELIEGFRSWVEVERLATRSEGPGGADGGLSAEGVGGGGGAERYDVGDHNIARQSQPGEMRTRPRRLGRVVQADDKLVLRRLPQNAFQAHLLRDPLLPLPAGVTSPWLRRLQARHSGGERAVWVDYRSGVPRVSGLVINEGEMGVGRRPVGAEREARAARRSVNAARDGGSTGRAGGSGEEKRGAETGDEG